ncbi:uncharacterized protein LOC126564582 [Anopheles maculipalpis]|uniref:uncharacterized protein LOC126564582 n=1 Tax=Anopheles maculipalpis TaxID=1496333 RepID=UPI002159818E|nr:uncharacterized protein LOC126564582 [Anopheles maculipalpis]
MKLYHLEKALCGEAAKVIDERSINEGNYECAWQLLTDRYENKRRLVDIHIHGLLNLKKQQHENYEELRSLVEEIDSHIENLKYLGEEFTGLSRAVIVYLIAQALHPETKKLWEGSVAKNEQPGYEKTMSFLKDRVSVLERSRDKVELKIRSRVSCYEVNLECLITPKVTGTIPTSNVNIDLSLLPIGTMLADRMFFKPQKVDMLIGAELFFDILRPNQLELAANMPMLRETHFGWIVSGTVEDPQEHVSSQRSCHASVEDVEEMMQRFWQVEEVPSASKLSKEELDCEAHFISTYQRDETGRFIVRLPFNESLDQLADSRALSLKRFLMQEKRLISNTELQEQYKTFLEEYEALEHCREGREENDPPNRQVYYMLHHAVLRPSSSSTKCRVVFDASAKPSPSQLSLNDVLHVGPVVQNDLVSIVLRFRKFRIAFSADISKMYRQIRHAEDDQRFLRIFWRSDPAHPMRVLELCTVTYGTASAPYLATRCLVQLVEEDGGAFPSASRIVKEETYMDDVLSGASSVEAAIEAQQELKQLLLRGGFPIHKWCSNSTEFLEQIPEADREKKIQNAERAINETITVLGVSWDPNADTLSVMHPTSPPTPTDPVKHHVTKRMLYAAIAKMFDPLGLVSPALVLAKLLTQRLWKLKISWDEPVDEATHREWQMRHV